MQVMNMSRKNYRLVNMHKNKYKNCDVLIKRMYHIDMKIFSWYSKYIKKDMNNVII